MTIKRKLFLLSILPSIAIILFSINHINYKYDSLKKQNKLLISTKIIKHTSALLHELQVERAFSSGYIQKQDIYFKNLLDKQKKSTDKKIKSFLKYFKTQEKKFFSKSTLNTKDSIDDYLSLLNSIRSQISDNKFSAENSFNYFSQLNAKLVQFTQEIKLYSTNKEIYDEIMAFKDLIIFNEISGQERALFAFIFEDKSDEYKLRKFYNLIEHQDSKFQTIKHFLENTQFLYTLEKIKKEYSNSYIADTRKKLINNSKKELNTILWVNSTTNRINDYFILENEIFKEIQNELNETKIQIKLSLIVQIVLAILIIFFLQVGAYFISKNIITSIKKLSLGIDDFFDFLNFRTNAPKLINTYSKDELNDMSQKINEQITYLQLNLEDDKDFIKETTKVTQLMKNGNFNKHIYLEPANPNLIELKIVFNELIYLIQNKIKEQTRSLEELNSSLENKVYEQTLELEKQLATVTASRDEVLNAQKAKDNFLANMSHEIRTPLNAILGFVTILQKRLEDEKNIKYLDIISTSGKSLLSIINDILDFSKIQSGKFTITPREIDPILEFSNTTLLFSSKVYEKHLIYAVYIDPNIAKSISVDDTRVKQILSNLLSNAIKFTAVDGMIKVRVLIEDEKLIISVQDSGIGIAKHNLDKVFSAFEQADGSTTRKYGGTGLGLSISSKLASLMDGTLEVVSKQNIGSTFTLNVPIKTLDKSPRTLLDINKIYKYKFAILHRSQDDMIFARIIKKYLQDLNITNVIELTDYQDYGYDILFFIPHDDYNEDIVETKLPAIAMLRSTQIKLAYIKHITSLYAPFTPLSVVQAIDDITVENIQDFERKSTDTIHIEEKEIKYRGKVLVAEDNKTNQMLIGLILFDYEIDYKIANNGIEVVKMFKEEQFDLVLMDENMPELNGLEAMKLIKEYEKENSLKGTAIVALTAAVLQSDIEKFLSEGMDGFVAKPIENKKLEFELDKYLKRV